MSITKIQTTARGGYLRNRKGQGSLTVAIIASTLFATIVASATSWYLSMNDKVDNFDNKLEAMSIAMSEWQRLEHMSLEELEANREKYKEPWTVGNYKISVTLGEQGTFTDGQCNTTASGDEKNCFKDTTMTVYDKDGKAIYSTRTLPLSSGGDSGGGGGFPDMSRGFGIRNSPHWYESNYTDENAYYKLIEQDGHAGIVRTRNYKFTPKKNLWCVVADSSEDSTNYVMWQPFTRGVTYTSGISRISTCYPAKK